MNLKLQKNQKTKSLIVPPLAGTQIFKTVKLEKVAIKQMKALGKDHKSLTLV